MALIAIAATVCGYNTCRPRKRPFFPRGGMSRLVPRRRTLFQTCRDGQGLRETREETLTAVRRQGQVGTIQMSRELSIIRELTGSSRCRRALERSFELMVVRSAIRPEGNQTFTVCRPARGMRTYKCREVRIPGGSGFQHGIRMFPNP